MSHSERSRELLIQMSRKCIVSATYGLPQSYYGCLSVHVADTMQTLHYIYQQSSTIPKDRLI